MMVEEWTERVLPPNADRLKITVDDEPGSGGPTHAYSCLYTVKGFDASQNPTWDGTNQHAVTLTMQCGPLSDGKPANGLTVAALLAIVIDQLGPPGAILPVRSIVALDHCQKALAQIKEA